jgi:hypothetical protein
MFYYLKRIACTLHAELCTFMILSRSVLLRMRNVSVKKVLEKIKTNIVKSDNVYIPKIGPFMR